MLVIDVQRLTKGYRRLEVLKDVDFHVEEGEICALLGPNGAGKTSLVEVLEGHRARDGGSVSVLGFDPGSQADFRRLRRIIGVVLQQTMLEPGLTPTALLRRQASYYRDPMPVDELIERLEFGRAATQPVRALSGGTRRRLDLALALVGRPQLLFLDEPTTGLDPVSRRNIRELITEINAAGTTVVLTSHDLDEVQELAHIVHILQGGRFVAAGSPGELVSLSTAPARVEFNRPVRRLETLPAGSTAAGDRVRYETREQDALVRSLRDWERETGETLENLTIVPPTLDEAYVELISTREARS